MYTMVTSYIKDAARHICVMPIYMRASVYDSIYLAVNLFVIIIVIEEQSFPSVHYQFNSAFYCEG